MESPVNNILESTLSGPTLVVSLFLFVHELSKSPTLGAVVPWTHKTVLGNCIVKVDSCETGLMVNLWASCDTTGDEIILNLLGIACISDRAIANETLFFKRFTSLEVVPRITGPVLVKVISLKTILVDERSTKAGIHERSNPEPLGFIPRWLPFLNVRERPFLSGMFLFFN